MFVFFRRKWGASPVGSMYFVYIYEPPASPPGATSRNPNDPRLIGKGLLLEGSTPNAKDKQVLYNYTCSSYCPIEHVYISSHLDFFRIESQINQGIPGSNFRFKMVKNPRSLEIRTPAPGNSAGDLFLGMSLFPRFSGFRRSGMILGQIKNHLAELFLVKNSSIEQIYPS